MKRFEFSEGTSDKFWEVKVRGNILVVHFGRIGTKGQVKEKPFSSPSAALTEKERLIQEKTRKGYVPVSAPEKTRKGYVPVSAPASTRSRRPAVIAVIQIGEDFEIAAKHVAKWLTECLRKKMTPDYFEQLWNHYLRGDEDEEGNKIAGSEVPNWNWDAPSDDLADFYRKAVHGQADKFIAFDKYYYAAIVALRGDPGVAKIVNRVSQSDDGDGSMIAADKWPPELGPGTPIQYFQLGPTAPECDAILRDGTKVRIEITYLSSIDKDRARVYIGRKKVREYTYEDEEDEDEFPYDVD